MSGYFYAYASEAKARQSNPSLFVERGGDWQLEGATLRSTSGVWLEQPVEDNSDPENPVLVSPGVRSKPYVFITAELLDGRDAARITPAGEQGFAV